MQSSALFEVILHVGHGHFAFDVNFAGQWNVGEFAQWGVLWQNGFFDVLRSWTNVLGGELQFEIRKTMVELFLDICNGAGMVDA